MNDEVKISRIVSPKVSEVDLPEELASKDSKIRPKSFSDFPGQDRVKKNLMVFVGAAKKNSWPLDHVLLHGPPGLGKTSLARIIAGELGSEFLQTSGPAIERPGDLAGLLAGVQENTVVFIDEIHRLPVIIEEVLYSAMEDFFIDVIVGQGPTSRSIKLPLKPFTLIGATTKTSMLSAPLMSRFGIQERFEYYDLDALCKIVERAAQIESIDIEIDAIKELACRSRGTPRIANRLLRRVRDFSSFRNETSISCQRVKDALFAMEIDNLGLEPMDRLILKTLEQRYSGGPVGIEALSYSLGEDRATIEEVYEPYLVFKGLIIRGPRGRELTELARKHLEIIARDGFAESPR